MSITFKDKLLEDTVREFLQLPIGEITTEQLSEVIGITVSHQKRMGYPVPWCSSGSAFNMKIPNFNFILPKNSDEQWIHDLKYFTNAKSLHIEVETNDLSPLKDMTSLSQLYISKSKNKDWSFLSNLLYLDYLYIQKSPFSDLTPLAELAEYQDKYLKDFHPSPHLRPIKRGISHVHLIECEITDVTPLSKCKFISDLDLSHNDIEDITSLVNISRLYYFTLRYGKLKDISPLKNKPGIYLMNVRHNQIEDISFIPDMNLSRLLIADNPIKDFSVLKGIHFVDADVSYYGERDFDREALEEEY